MPDLSHVPLSDAELFDIRNRAHVDQLTSWPPRVLRLLATIKSRKKAFDEATSLLWLLSEDDPNADMAARREAAEDFLAEHRPVNPNVTSIG